MALPMRAALLSGLFAAILAAGCRHERAPVAVALSPASCAGCHAEIAREWEGSLHHAAYDDPLYQRAFAIEPLPFCTGCHAPLANAIDPGPSPAHQRGVDCTSCHAKPHTRTSAESTCAGCHEFAFPGLASKMQLTVTEHARSSSPSAPCGSCHLPTENGHRSHRFAASKDPAMLQSAAHITAERSGGAVRVRFTPDRVGHAFPTGDLFRRLHVVVENDAGERAETFLDRKTKAASISDPNAMDDRPFAHGPSPAVVELVAPSGPLRWRVVYERVEHPVGSVPGAAALDGAIEVASGTIGE